MFYYAQYDTTSYAVTSVTPSESAITTEGYVQITEEQYNNGDLVGKYYNPFTEVFEDGRGWICDTTLIQYKRTNANIEEKFDAIDEAIEGKADSDHTHDIATETTSGLMGNEDKAKLNGIEAGANNYTHPATHSAEMITGLSDVATSGDYNDLSNKPTIPEAYSHPVNHPASMITGLSDVATSGSYNDLSDKPTIPSAYTHPASHPASMIEGLSTVATTGSYEDLTDKPTIPTSLPANGGNADTVDGKNASDFATATHNHDTAYAEKTHTHAQSEITGLATALSGKANASHTHNEYALATTVEELTETVEGKANATHTHGQGDITGLTSALAGKADSTHTHSQYAATNHTHSGFVTEATYTDGMEGKANTSHTHAQSEITGLSTALSGKANTSHTHDNYALKTDFDELSDTVNGKANASHTHTLDNVSDTTSYVKMTAAERTKLSGIATGANKTTVDSAMSSSSTNPVQNKVVNTALGNKVDKVDGKGLSTNDYTTAEKNKLAGIAAGANAYTHPSYTAKSSGLYKVAVDSKGHVSETTAVTKADITALGIPSTNTTYNNATTSAAGLMSATDKTKLDGVETGANKTTVDGALSSTSTNPVQNKVVNSALAGKANSSHTHGQSEITGLETALAGKANSSHTHTAAQVGAAASNHNHDSAYISKDLLFTNVEGGVEYSYGSGSGKNVLTEISNMPQGFHTIYAIAGTTGNPETAESYRYFIHKTSTTIGWVYAFGADGSVYSNYLAGANTYKGWKTIHDAKRKPLWTGSYYMTAGHTATPSKKLSQCEHGWMLLWSDYDPDTGDVNNTDFCTTFIPNRNWAGGTWNGAAFYCDCPRYTAGTATDSESRVIKVLNVYDNKLVGVANNNAAPRNDVVLRAIYEF